MFSWKTEQYKTSGLHLLEVDSQVPLKQEEAAKKEKKDQRGQEIQPG